MILKGKRREWPARSNPLLEKATLVAITKAEKRTNMIVRICGERFINYSFLRALLLSGEKVPVLPGSSQQGDHQRLERD